MALRDTNDLADFIVKKYQGSEKIIEVGVGSQPWIAKRIKDRLSETRVIVTDINRSNLEYIRRLISDVEIIQDNIFSPRIRIYEGARLVYSIRPPTEIVLELLKLSSILGFDVLIRPYSDEEGAYTYPKESGWQQMLHGKSFFNWLTGHAHAFSQKHIQ